ncbi:MAG: SIS domain-containing protein [Alphaproteobacteria bacterium]
MSFAGDYFAQVRDIAEQIDTDAIDALAEGIRAVRDRGGRLFILGVGGSAANASHAVNDFRKLCNVEAYAPTDNVSELTARTNDEGWPTVFAAWLQVSRLSDKDGILVFSVGGGDMERNISPNLVEALKLASDRNASVFGIVGRDGGYTRKVGHNVVLVPVIAPDLVTPHSEAFQAVVWHCVVSHPSLKVNATKW